MITDCALKKVIESPGVVCIKLKFYMFGDISYLISSVKNRTGNVHPNQVWYVPAAKLAIGRVTITC